MFLLLPLFFVRRLFAAWAVASALVPMAQMKPNSSRPAVTISIVRKFISKVLVQSVSLEYGWRILAKWEEGNL
jgi:hypothetical protein